MVYSERRSDQVYRVIDLSPEVEPDKVKYALNNGKLEITFPKNELGRKSIADKATA